MEEIIYKRLMGNCFGSKSVAIYGGAYHLEKQGKNSLQDIAEGMSRAITDAKFFAPEVKPSQVAKNFCSLFFIDYMMMEVYLDMRFEELDNLKPISRA